LLENHRANGIKLVDHALNFVNDLKRSLLEAIGLLQDFFEQRLFNILDVEEKIF
jgi:hypothetical protein